MRREHKWSALRIGFELALEGTTTSRRVIFRILLQLGLDRRRFIDPNGESNWEPQRIIAERPGHMVHVDVKKVGRIPDGGGRRVHGRDSPEERAVERTKRRGTRRGYAYLHSAIDGHTRLAYTESLDNETRGASLPPNSSNARNAGSPHTASHRSNGSSLTTGLATARKSSPKRCSRPGSKGSDPTRRAITGKWSATTGSSPKSSSTPAPGSQNRSDQTDSRSGICITTTTDPTAHTMDNRPRLRLPRSSTLSWPPTPRR